MQVRILLGPPRHFLLWYFQGTERDGVWKLTVREVATAPASVAAARTRPEPQNTGIYLLIAGFGAAWWLFDLLSLGSVSAHYDLSELSEWAQHFAWGYKHPPLSAVVFGLWFAVFPRTDWAAHLLAATTITATLFVTWRLLCDHLDRERALVGICSLTLVPFYTFLAIKFNVNLVLMPFWAAALLFYLRARRTLGFVDAALAGLFIGLAFLGKYWSIYLVMGVGAASLVGPNVSGYWRSSAPYATGVIAALVVAPHLYWLATGHHDALDQYVGWGLTSRSVPDISQKVFSYLAGAVAYIAVPLAFVAYLRPSRAAMMDTVVPADPTRRICVVLLIVPLLAPILVDIIIPHRLTPLWTYPNWPLLPVVLFGSPLVEIQKGISSTRSALVTILVTIGSLISAPFVGRQHLSDATYLDRQHWQELAARIQALSPKPIRSISGTAESVLGLPFYLPETRVGAPSAADAGEGFAIVCRSDDSSCRTIGDAAIPDREWTETTLRRTFLGVSGPAVTYRFKVSHGEQGRNLDTRG